MLRHSANKTSQFVMIIKINIRILMIDQLCVLKLPWTSDVIKLMIMYSVHVL